jgi:hypothetical protein
VPRVAWRLTFVVLWRIGLIDARRGLLRGLTLGGSGLLFWRLRGSLAGGRFGSLLPRFGGSTHAAGATVVRAVGDGWQSRHQHCACAEGDGGAAIARRAAG